MLYIIAAFWDNALCSLNDMTDVSEELSASFIRVPDVGDSKFL
jgi:hypothetical protein